MKQDWYKDKFYYIAAAPAVLALWPLILLGVYLPSLEERTDNLVDDYTESRTVMQEIIELDPARISGGEKQKKGFNYADAVDEVANEVNISPNDYKISTQKIVKSRKRKHQSARISLEKVDIARVAAFLSKIQLTWPNLQCESIKLNARSGEKDNWDVSLGFDYYY